MAFHRDFPAAATIYSFEAKLAWILPTILFLPWLNKHDGISLSFERSFNLPKTGGTYTNHC